MTGSRIRPALLSICCIFTCFHVDAAVLRPFEAVEPHMGTLFRIKLYAESEAQAQSAFRSAFDRVAELDSILSDYQPQSELNQLTLNAVGRPVHVGADLFRVLRTAQSIASETEGAFDVTLGPVTHLWREARKKAQLPEAEAIQRARAKCGFRKLHLQVDIQTVMVDEPGMQLDLGGIAKGYAADEAISTLRHAGINRALVAASGDLAFSDAPPDKSGWSIGIDSLDSAGQPFTKTLVLSNAAVSTSGDNEQHLDNGGLRYSHVIDPRTGMGLTNQLSVTIVAPQGIEADALTKVVSVWGKQRGIGFAERRPGVKALVVDRSMNPLGLSGALASVGVE